MNVVVFFESAGSSKPFRAILTLVGFVLIFDMERQLVTSQAGELVRGKPIIMSKNKNHNIKYFF